jgi:hypothetical protein
LRDGGLAVLSDEEKKCEKNDGIGKRASEIPKGGTVRGMKENAHEKKAKSHESRMRL